jgi:hypothetical protein
VPGQVADIRFLLIEARGPLLRSIEITSGKGGDAQGVHERPGPQAYPFRPGRFQFDLGPLPGSVRRSRDGVEDCHDLDRAVARKLVLSWQHVQEGPLTVSTCAGKLPGR